MTGFDLEPTLGDTIQKRQFCRHPLPDSPNELSECEVLVS